MKRFLIATVVGALLLGVTAAGASSAVQKKQPEPVVVTDIQIPVAGQAPVTACLVRPVKSHKHLAGALYLHWFEPPASTQNRTEFLSEAIALASKGAVAVLPQLTFPWEGDPVGDQTDRTKVTNQLKAVEAAYNTRSDRTASTEPWVSTELGLR